MKQVKKSLALCVVLLIINLAFIYGNSLLPGDISGKISGGLLAKLMELFPRMVKIGEKVLRKLGHFSEFACLGLLLCWLFRLLGSRGFHGFTDPFLFGLLAASLDETIQRYVPGRASSLLDVWIDGAGVLTGIILLHLGQALITMKRHKSSGGTL